MYLYRYISSRTPKLLFIVSLFLFAHSAILSAQDTCVVLDLVTKSGGKGDTVCVEVRVYNFKNVLSFQFPINYNPNTIRPISVSNVNKSLLGFDDTKVRINKTTFDIRTQWDDVNGDGENLPDGAILFEICFVLNGPPGSCSSIYFSDFPIQTEFTNPDGDEICVRDTNPNDQICIEVPSHLCVISSSCATQTNMGSLTIKAWGGTPPYLITSANPITNSSLQKAGDCLIINNLTPGVYDFKITDAVGKDTIIMVNIMMGSDIVITNDINYTANPICYNIRNGRIGINYIGGAEPLLIAWSPLNIYGVDKVSGLGPGKYTVTVTDSLGCMASKDFVLRADTLFSKVTIDKYPSCAGICDGQVTAMASGGDPFIGGNYEFYWSFNTKRNCIRAKSCTNDSICGDQFVLIKDRGCTDTIFFSLPFGTGNLQDSIVVDSVRCFGEANGVAHVFVSSKATLNTPIQVTMQTISGNAIPGGVLNGTEYTSSMVRAGKYVITIMDAAGCSILDTFDIFEPDSLEIIENALDTTASCNPGNDAFIDLRAFGGTQPYTYQWNFMAKTTPRIVGLSAGTYTVTVTDAHGCTQSKSYTVSAPTGPKIIGFNNTNVFCPGDSSGCVEVLYNLGTGTVNTFMWNVPGNNPRICNLPSGKYTIRIEDSNGCFDTASTTINFSGNGIRIDSATIRNPSCPGKSDGFIIVTAQGGNGLLTYKWSNNITSQVNVNIKAGTYTVTIDDIGGCPPVIDSFTLIDRPKPTMQVSGLQPTSCSAITSCDGQAQIEVFTSDTIVTITWSSGEQKQYFNRQNSYKDTARLLCSGRQYAIVSVNNLCSDTVYFDILPAVPISIDSSRLTIIPPKCYKFTDGSVSVAAKGGTGPYTYMWENNPPSPILSGIGDGYYKVTIRDAKGCIFLDSVRVRQPDSIKIQVILGSTLDVSCFGKQDGRIATTWTGGNKGKGQFVWNPNVGQDSVLTGLAAGTYTLVVFDTNLCSGTVQHTINEPPKISATITPIDTPACTNDQFVFSVLNATGGAGPQYRYTIQDGPPNQIGDEVPLFSGIYSIKIYDKNNCVLDTSIVVPDPINNLSVDFGKETETIQLGDSVLLRGIVNSTTLLDSIIWTPIQFVSTSTQTTSFVNPPRNQMYVLTVVDENGCTASDKISIIVENNRRFYVPNIISPNNDGTNDHFKISVGPDVEEISLLQIYDRWGGLVYSNSYLDISAGEVNTWNGRFKDQPCNPGVYAYIASVKFRDGFVLQYRGDITLIR
ncbi:MAG: gliding motility-associated C-terminal domain-containing protein [Saprospiraceae bacterium]|nr:gliding motility-associated C-terminal domain-containing protein [Candidatus Defluviibacterium haderslevense]MCC7025690.1 gliding motility-associated C-terminal domain-containing protein [Saprospiraceae bacterium]